MMSVWCSASGSGTGATTVETHGQTGRVQTEGENGLSAAAWEPLAPAQAPPASFGDTFPSGPRGPRTQGQEDLW